MTVPVSERAIAARVNRKLKPHDEMLRRSRSNQARIDLGDYFVVDFRRNCVMRKDVDLEEFGRELGCLKSWERLALEDHKAT